MSDRTSHEIELGNGLVAIIDAEDFDWVSRYSWHFKPHGGCVGYVRSTARVGSRTIHHVLHRLVSRARPHETVDHINRNGLDNRKANLRFCNLSQNMVNRVFENKLGYRGIRRSDNKFRAGIAYQGIQKYGPRRATPVEAAADYDALARDLHGEFAVLNFPVQS